MQEDAFYTLICFFKVFGVAGGIITLVTGASLASIFEIIYFLTVRLWEEGGKVSLGKLITTLKHSL